MENAKTNLFLVGRVLVGAFYLMMAFNHFTGVGSMSKYAASMGVPLPTVAVLVSGVLLLVGGLSILLGFKPDIGVAALVLFFLPVTFMMHPFWAVPEAQAQGEMVNFTKNLALMGSALMFLKVPQPWAKSVGS